MLNSKLKCIYKILNVAKCWSLHLTISEWNAAFTIATQLLLWCHRSETIAAASTANLLQHIKLEMRPVSELPFKLPSRR